MKSTTKKSNVIGFVIPRHEFQMLIISRLKEEFKKNPDYFVTPLCEHILHIDGIDEETKGYGEAYYNPDDDTIVIEPNVFGQVPDNLDKVFTQAEIRNYSIKQNLEVRK